MAATLTAEQLGQRALDVDIVDDAQLQSVWSELGTRNASLAAFQQELLRRGLVTNFQLDRLMRGLRTGFFYGDYKVLYNVGSGTFARVFRTVHRHSGELFAVKVLRSRFSNPKSDADNPKRIEQFRREGELGATLVHPNIVPVHDVVTRGLIHYIVMDFIEGRNLREFYRARRQFDPLEAGQIMEGVVAGLSYAFQKGVTHRDLKMSNVLLSSDGQAKLVDFGLAGLDASYGDNAAAADRTIDYAGLERATGVRRDDTRSDIFFTGCIFYQLLSGKPPLAETQDRVQRLSKGRYENIKPIRDVMPNVPPPLAMVVSRAIEFDPDRRYQTPADLLTDLKLAMKRCRTSADGRADAGQELASREGLNEQGEPRRLMVVESEGKMQDVFRQLFKKNGYRVLVASDPERALQRFYDDHDAADLMLFSSIAIGRSALAMFNRFGQEPLTREVPAVLLLGKEHDWADEADIAEHRITCRMPIKPRELREVLLNATTKQVS
jgi:serine/threonine-protein kinase